MTKHHDILAFIQGIDQNVRLLSSAEVDDLIKPGLSPLSQGDWFGQWLARTPVEDRQLSLRSLLNQTFSQNGHLTFGVADGVSIVYDHSQPSNPLNSVSRHMRFLTVVLPDAEEGDRMNIQNAITTRTVLISSGNFPDGDGKTPSTYSSGGFLQCISWDPHAFGRNQGMARFYQRDSVGWIFFGSSFDAFNAASADRGAFDGHVGGSLIMKELTAPWTHWFDVGNAGAFINSLGSTPEKGSACDPHNVLYDELFTRRGGVAFGLLGRAELLERVVENAVVSWYRTRFIHDFETNQPLSISTPISQWIASILLSRAINIATSATSTTLVFQSASNIQGIPRTFFFNSRALEILLPDISPPSQFSAANDAYRQGINKLKLSLYYFDRYTSTLKIAVEGIEGPFAFPIIEPGLEDYVAIQTLDVRGGIVRILPRKAIAAMLMVDFWNPIYSVRRERLMKYLPETATFDPETRTYNVLPQFVTNIHNSNAATDPQSPEYEILQLLQTPDDTWVSIFTERVNAYLSRVSNRFRENMQEAVDDYMALAESRRVLFRKTEDEKPDSTGLNEFTLTLPRAANEVPYLRMKEDGHIEVISAEDVHILLERGAHATGSCPVHVLREDAVQGL